MLYCSQCGSQVPDNSRFCSACAAPVSSIVQPNEQNALARSRTDNKQSAAHNFGFWVGRHPIIAGLLTLFLVGLLGNALLKEEREQNQSEPAKTLSGTQAPQANLLKVPPPKFRVFKFKTDAPASYVVPVDTTHDQLRSLLWFFRQNVRTGEFEEIGFTQPTSKQWGTYGHQSGMLLVYKGEKCANEEYISPAQLEKGNLGPCGYGEHDDAYYQWGIDGDPNKDDAGFRDKSGNMVAVFDYKDDWHASSEPLKRVDEAAKGKWLQDYGSRQRFAVQMTNTLNEEGFDITVSANGGNPRQLDFQSQLFKNTVFRESFMNKALPQIRRNLCGAGFQSIAILQESGADAGQSYPLQCN